MTAFGSKRRKAMSAIRGTSGLVLLNLSFSHFDPQETSAMACRKAGCIVDLPTDLVEPRVAQMADSNTVTFNDAEAYERFMGRWSRSVGAIFLDWVAAPKGARWLDAGCGTGIFTELIVN